MIPVFNWCWSLWYVVCLICFRNALICYTLLNCVFGLLKRFRSVNIYSKIGTTSVLPAPHHHPVTIHLHLSSQTL
ncbi:hypothetical protein BDQ17DRAFT_1372680, partial [Cyathus striatus]